MIGFLKGTVYSKGPSQIILLTGGVGYLVIVPATTLPTLKESSQAALFIYPHIKEEAFDLYGFKTPEELDMFKLVMTVSGIGPKTAILVVDRGVENVEQAIKNADLDFFTPIPRLGRKNAQKIIIELKNKLGSLKELDLSEQGVDFSEAIDALRSMGYSKIEAQKALKEVSKDLKLEQKITAALRNLGKSYG